MKDHLTLGSLFDGIGGWQLAAVHNGVTPIWASEIEAFPCAVTAKHFPDTLQLGDITTLNGAELPPVDIICAGSPCQDLSVAGKQEGLNGARSGLFMDAIRIVRDMRLSTGGRQPRYFVWENVPGAFSSNSGADYRAVLEEITEAEIPMPDGGKWAEAGVVEWAGCSLAWRVLDAQYWGVPQRRRRIFLVCDFTGQSAGEILFERESVSRDSSESGEAREGFAAGAESGAYIPSKARSLTARNDGSPCVDRGPDVVAVDTYNGLLTGDVSCPLTTNGGSTTSSQPKVMIAAVAVYGVGVDNGKAGTLDASYYKGQGERQGTERTAVCIGNGQLDQARLSDKVGALNCMHDQQAVMIQKTVRRLTPTECERLQGLPDGYTLIDDKTCSDTARYKALGNGMAQPCADYVIRRIKEVSEA